MTQVQPQTVLQAAHRECFDTTDGGYLNEVHTQLLTSSALVAELALVD
jgi:hypothetical protein